MLCTVLMLHRNKVTNTYLDLAERQNVHHSKGSAYSMQDAQIRCIDWLEKSVPAIQKSVLVCCRVAEPLTVGKVESFIKIIREYRRNIC